MDPSKENGKFLFNLISNEALWKIYESRFVNISNLLVIVTLESQFILIEAL